MQLDRPAGLTRLRSRLTRAQARRRASEPIIPPPTTTVYVSYGAAYATWANLIHTLEPAGWRRHSDTMDVWTATEAVWGGIAEQYGMPLGVVLVGAGAVQTLDLVLVDAGLRTDTKTRPAVRLADLLAPAVGWTIARWLRPPGSG
jgi:hypothetical protein